VDINIKLNNRRLKMVEAYCVKCKEKGKTMKDAEITQTAKGGYMAKGKCPVCGTVMCAMMSKDNAEKAIKDGVKKSF
jgi:predicted nucleic acid binding AN1-type Zn finger protein